MTTEQEYQIEEERLMNILRTGYAEGETPLRAAIYSQAKEDLKQLNLERKLDPLWKKAETEVEAGTNILK